MGYDPIGMEDEKTPAQGGPVHPVPRYIERERAHKTEAHVLAIEMAGRLGCDVGTDIEPLRLVYQELLTIRERLRIIDY